jgi:hypothetical protein
MFEALKKLDPDQTVYLPHVCNDVGAWGAGFVVPLARAFPKTRERYIAWHQGQPPPDCTYPGAESVKFGLGATQIMEVQQQGEGPRIIVCNMIAQYGVAVMGLTRPIRYNHLVKCMESVADHAIMQRKPTIHCPMFGAALAGGDWNVIEPLIMDCWHRKALEVTVYYLPGTLPTNWTLPPTEEKDP